MPDDNIKDWLTFAQRDYDIACYLSQNFRPLPVENICYGCQQAIEKALKAVLIHYAGNYPKTHDIELLQELCKEYTDAIDLTISITKTLTRFATKSRYPDNVNDFAPEDAALAIKYGKIVLDKVKQLLA